MNVILHYLNKVVLPKRAIRHCHLQSRHGRQKCQIHEISNFWLTLKTLSKPHIRNLNGEGFGKIGTFC